MDIARFCSASVSLGGMHHNSFIVLAAFFSPHGLKGAMCFAIGLGGDAHPGRERRMVLCDHSVSMILLAFVTPDTYKRGGGETKKTEELASLSTPLPPFNLHCPCSAAFM